MSNKKYITQMNNFALVPYSASTVSAKQMYELFYTLYNIHTYLNILFDYINHLIINIFNK